MPDYDAVDFFADESLLEDPYPYFDHLRAKCPVVPTAHHGVVAVSGYEEASEVYLNSEDFSSCNSVIGPFAAFPVPLEGDDVAGIIETHRDQLPMSEHMVTMDPPDHTRERSLIMRLLTPKRLKENEAFMWGLADRQIDEFVGDGRCEFIRAYTQPFAMLVVADVLGVPEADHQRFREGFGLSGSPGKIGAEGKGMSGNALDWLDEWFTQYIEERRREPRDDVLTEPGARHLSRRLDARRGQRRADGDLPVRGRPGDDGPTARGRPQVPLRVPRAAGRAAGAPRPHPRVHRGGVADREPGQGRLPPGQARHDGGRGGHRGGHARDAAERRGQPGPAPLRVPGRVPRRPAQRQGPHRLRARGPLLPRWATGARGGPGQHRADPRPHARHPPLRGTPRPALGDATSTTNRRGSCVA